MAVADPSGSGSGSTGVDLNSIVSKALAGGSDMGNIFGGSGDATGGLVGGLILGSLLRNNGNLWGGNGDGIIAGRVAATPNDVQNTVGFINTVQDINSARRDIFQSQGTIQNQIAQALQTELVTNLQGQIANINAINNSTQVTGNALDQVSAQLAADITAVEAAIANQGQALASRIDATQLAIVQGQAAINQNIANSQYNTAQAIKADGDATRALIQSIETANLNRQITVAQNEITELRNERAVRGSGIDITNNINQNQAQAQQQQQLVLTNGLLQQLVGEIQRNTQSVVNLGTMTGTAQTAANTRVNS